MVALRNNPLFRLYKLVWWIVAIWLSAAVLTGVIRGVFVTGPVPTADPAQVKAPAPSSAPSQTSPTPPNR